MTGRSWALRPAVGPQDVKLTQPDLGTLQGLLLYPLQQPLEVGLILDSQRRTLRLREVADLTKFT